MAESIVRDKSFEFALQIIRLYQELQEKREYCSGQEDVEHRAKEQDSRNESIKSKKSANSANPALGTDA